VNIALAGYNGFIGRKFVSDRQEDRIILLPRKLLYGEITALKEAIKDADVVVNLAGSPINTRWTRRNKRVIEESRFGVNTRLVEAMNQLEKKPAHFITASAIGIYQSKGIHTESSGSVAENFLASVVKVWEQPLSALHPEIRAAVLRIGIVLGRDGGMLPIMARVSKAGVLPVMGSGNQIYSFIHMDDLISAMRFILEEREEGVFHLTAPNPVDNATFTRSLAKYLGVKIIFRMPEFVLKAALGESHIMVTEGPRVIPERLLRHGFVFRFPEIDTALQNLVQKY
jgi:uncharacterized protein (TIGR01777 family)